MKLKPQPNHCIIDYVSFTWTPEQLDSVRKVAQQRIKAGEAKSLSDYINANLTNDEVQLLDEDVRIKMQNFLTKVSAKFFEEADAVADAWEEVFVTQERPYGKFGYRYCWELYFNGQHIGVACAGAKNGGCYVSFSGLGCSLIDMRLLHDSIINFPNIRLTRVDPAFDDYQGVYCVDTMQEKYLDFEFVTNGTPPRCHMFLGGGSLKLSKKESDTNKKRGYVEYEGGRTFYVGSRESGKLYRCYEKGKQQGDPNSKWVRHELELHSKNRIIPLWVLLRPQDVLAGAYPALDFIKTYVPEAIPTVVKTKKMTAKITYQSSVENLKRVGGALINVMRRSRGMTDSEIVESLIGEPHTCPVALRKIAVSIEGHKSCHQ